MADLLLVCILILIIGGASFYVIDSKKKGVKCIGCAHAGDCGGRVSKGKNMRECKQKNDSTKCEKGN